MYHLRATIYEQSQRYEGYAYYWVSDPENSEPIVSAHLEWEDKSFFPAPEHTQIMHAVWDLCHELAANLDAPLF